jgi:hypothetical protein
MNNVDAYYARILTWEIVRFNASLGNLFLEVVKHVVKMGVGKVSVFGNEYDSNYTELFAGVSVDGTTASTPRFESYS